MDKKEESARNQTFCSSSSSGSYDNEDFNSSSLLDPSQPSLATKWCSDNEQPPTTEKEDETKKRKFASSEQAFDSKKVKTEVACEKSTSSKVASASTEALVATELIDLDPSRYNRWTKEQVCSLLVAEAENGGAGLSVEDVKLLYDVGFNGTSLANIVTYIQKKDEFFALEQLKTTFKEADIPITVELSTTLQSVVFWVDNLLKTRLYHLWTTEQMKKNITETLLSLEQAELLIGAKFDGKKVNNFYRMAKEQGLPIAMTHYGFNNKLLSPCNSLIDWISTLHLHIVIGFQEVKITLDPSITPEKARQKQLSTLISASDIMPFLGSEILVKQILPIFYSRFAKPGDLGKDKVNHPIIFFTGTMGIGKTRTAMEYISSLAQSLKEPDYLIPYFTNKFELYLRINYNGLKMFNFTIDYSAGESEPNFEKFVVVRLFYIFLTYCSAIITDIPYAEKLAHKYPTVTKCILYLKSLIFKESSATMFHIVVDEFQLLCDYAVKVGTTTRSYLDQICNCLGTASVELAKHNIMLVCTLAGTHYRSLDKIIRSSTHPFKHFDTTRPRMTIFDIFQFVKEFIGKFPEQSKNLGLNMDNFFQHPSLLNCINACFTVPRKVEQLAMNLKASCNWDQILSNINSYTLSGLLPDDIAPWAQIIYAYSFTEKPVSRDENIFGSGIQVAKLEEEGLIVLIPHPNEANSYCIHLPFFDLIKFGKANSKINDFHILLKKIIMAGGAYNCHKTELEKFNAYFEIVLNECYTILGITKLKFYERYGGMLPSKKILESGLWNSDVILPKNMTYMAVDASKTPSDSCVLYHYEKTANKKGCDRTSLLAIDKEDETIEYTLKYQDRGIDLRAAIEKNRERGLVTNVKPVDVSEEWNKNNGSSSDDRSILLYCSLKTYTKTLVQSLLLQSKKKFCLYEKNCMILGNANLSAVEEFQKIMGETYQIGLQHYYGIQLYDLLFQTSLPKLLNASEVSTSNWNLLSLVFGTTVDSEIEKIINVMNNSTSLENFKQGLDLDSSLSRFAPLVPKRFTNTITDTTKIFIFFKKDNVLLEEE